MATSLELASAPDIRCPVVPLYTPPAGARCQGRETGLIRETAFPDFAGQDSGIDGGCDSET